MADSLFNIKVKYALVLLRQQFKNFPERARAEILDSNERYAAKQWVPALAEQGPSLGQVRALTSGADVVNTALGVTLRAAKEGVTFSGGLNTSGRKWAGFEFGATPRTITQISPVSRKGYQRIINVQFAPRRTKGKIVYPAARKIGPTLIARYVKAIIKAIAQGNPNIKTR